MPRYSGVELHSLAARTMSSEVRLHCAGAIAQTIWNLRCEQPAEFGLKDVDLIYFDEQDLSFGPRPVMRDAFVIYFNTFRKSSMSRTKRECIFGTNKDATIRSNLIHQ